MPDNLSNRDNSWADTPDVQLDFVLAPSEKKNITSCKAVKSFCICLTIPAPQINVSQKLSKSYYSTIYETMLASPIMAQILAFCPIISVESWLLSSFCFQHEEILKYD
jgi:hypothetical protein